MLAVYTPCSAGWGRVALVMQKPDPELLSADSEGHPWHCRISRGGQRHHLAVLGVPGGWNQSIASLAAVGEHLHDAVWPRHFKLSLN